MRVLMLTTLYPNPIQPYRAPFSGQEARALARLVRLSVISPVSWIDEARIRLAGGPALPTDRRSMMDGVPAEHPRYRYPPGILRRLHGSCFRESIRAAFEQAIRQSKPELIYAQWAYPDGWAAVELAGQTGLPVVLKVHGSDLRLLNQFPGRLGKTAEALQRADAVVAISRDLAERAVALGASPARVHLIHGGLDADLFRPGDPGSSKARLGLPGAPPIVLFVGNLLPVKGPDVLIEACALLARRGLSFLLYFVGQGPLMPRLRRRVDRLGLRDQVRFVGPRPLQKLPEWYRAADLVVLPSRSEGLPNVLLEATACGTPYVASRVGGVPEVAHLGSGRLVPPEDVEALAEAISEALRTASCRREAAPWRRSFDDAASDLARLFEDVIRGGGTPVSVPGTSPHSLIPRADLEPSR